MTDDRPERVRADNAPAEMLMLSHREITLWNLNMVAVDKFVYITLKQDDIFVKFTNDFLTTIWYNKYI